MAERTLRILTSVASGTVDIRLAPVTSTLVAGGSSRLQLTAAPVRCSFSTCGSIFMLTAPKKGRSDTYHGEPASSLKQAY